MKTLNETFTDSEFAKLRKAKREYAKEVHSNLTWAKFIMLKCTKGVSAKRLANRTQKGVKINCLK